MHANHLEILLQIQIPAAGRGLRVCTSNVLVLPGDAPALAHGDTEVLHCSCNDSLQNTPVT